MSYFSLENIQKYIDKERNQCSSAGNTITVKQALLNIMTKDQRFATCVHLWHKKCQQTSHYFRKAAHTVSDSFRAHGITWFSDKCDAVYTGADSEHKQFITLDRKQYKTHSHIIESIHFSDDLLDYRKIDQAEFVALKQEKQIVEALALETRLYKIFYSTKDYIRTKDEAKPIAEMFETFVGIDYLREDVSLYTYWLNFNFYRKSLYIAYQGLHKRCLFSYTSGMFLPKDAIKRRTKQERKLFLKNLRILKKKERKRERRKLEKVTWKKLRRAWYVKRFMLRWVGMMLRLFVPYRLNMHIRGTPKRFNKILNYIRYNNLFRFDYRPHIYYIFIKNKYKSTVTRRAIRRRIVKRIKLQ